MKNNIKLLPSPTVQLSKNTKIKKKLKILNCVTIHCGVRGGMGTSVAQNTQKCKMVRLCTILEEVGALQQRGDWSPQRDDTRLNRLERKVAGPRGGGGGV